MHAPRSPFAWLSVAGWFAASCLPSSLTYDPGTRRDGGRLTAPEDASSHDASSPASGGAPAIDARLPTDVHSTTDGTDARGTGGVSHDAGHDGFSSNLDAARAADADATDADAVDGAPPPCPGTHGAPIVVVGGGLTYCVDQTEITRAEYEDFLSYARFTKPKQATGCAWNDDFEPLGSVDASAGGSEADPVTGVDWCDAYAYCAWAGKHLCGRIGGGPNPFDNFTRADTSEWFNACSNQGANAYPYGTSYDPNACAGSDSTGRLTEAGTMPACIAASGALDLSGNVWEWEDSCVSESGASDVCRARGGSFQTSGSLLACDADSTVFSMFRRSTRDPSVGFRCCAGTYLPP
jgi:hypothetical protein